MVHPRMTAVGGFSAQFGNNFVSRLPADFFSRVELTRRKVPGGQPAGLVENIGQNIGPIRGKPLAGHRMGIERVEKLLLRRLESVRILKRRFLSSGGINDHGLEFLESP